MLHRERDNHNLGMCECCPEEPTTSTSLLYQSQPREHVMHDAMSSTGIKPRIILSILSLALYPPTYPASKIVTVFLLNAKYNTHTGNSLSYFKSSLSLHSFSHTLPDFKCILEYVFCDSIDRLPIMFYYKEHTNDI